MRFSKQVVMAVVALNIVFTIAVLFCFMRTGNEPAVLIGAWFSFTTVELWQLAMIKKAKVKGGGNSEGYKPTAPEVTTDSPVTYQGLQDPRD